MTNNRTAEKLRHKLEFCPPPTTQTQHDPKRWAVFTWFADNGLPPPVESEITDLLNRIENA